MSQEMTQHQYVEVRPQEVPVAADVLPKGSIEEGVQFEEEKHLIRTHPLFSLLELLFEKCERATRGEETPSSSTYDEEIQDFVHHHKTMLNPIYIDNPEIDNLMIKAIQVLRIHLLELEKVNDLCKDFCHRYITCLKGKMHSENLLRSDMGPFGDISVQHGAMHTSNTQCMATTPNANVTVNQQGEIVAQGAYQQSLTDGQMLHQSENGIDGSTPLSQVGVSSPPAQHMHGHSLSSQQLHYLHHQQLSCSAQDDVNGRKTKRGVLPKHATEILRSWLFSHIVHPYPTEDEKRTLATQTNLTLLQVNNWFINARRRILQPMLDASNPEASASSNKVKKAKQQNNRPTERFWPNSISVSSNGSQGAEDEQTGNCLQGQHREDVSRSSPNRTTTDAPPATSCSSPAANPASTTSHFHHYPHNEVALNTGAHVPLSMVNH